MGVEEILVERFAALVKQNKGRKEMEGRTDVSDMYFGRWMERRRETRKRVVQTHEGMIISVFYVTSLTRLLSPQTHRR